ncbi:MAG: hypothetical protein LBM66_02585 [Bifidobacteriaceae bacterium]|jgi:hypothetical protein|nr:hypothetical protein [Bifidobacteriaceae bacterium]
MSTPPGDYVTVQKSPKFFGLSIAIGNGLYFQSSSPFTVEKNGDLNVSGTQGAVVKITNSWLATSTVDHDAWLEGTIHCS